MLTSDLIKSLGDDVDLLTRSDAWLEEQRRNVSYQMEQLAQELHAIHAAQRIKPQLQQQNLVALQELVKDETGQVIDIKITIQKLSVALQTVDKSLGNCAFLELINTLSQRQGWRTDGYEIG